MCELNGRLADDLVVIGVRVDPKPADAVLHVNAKGTVVQSNTHGGVLADPFELQRRMACVGAQQSERLVRE